MPVRTQFRRSPVASAGARQRCCRRPNKIDIDVGEGLGAEISLNNRGAAE